MIELFCIKYAESTLREDLALLGGSADKQIPITFCVYLIKADDRNILVDAGCDTMPGFVMRKFFSPAFLLRQLDITSDEIDDVVITHAHHDHIEAINHFKNATVHITKSEYENGKGYIPEKMRVNTFEGEFLIAPCVKIVEWGGHSKGSAIVEILFDDLTVVLAGDECYTNENIEKRIPTGSFFDKKKARKFVQEFSKDGYVVHTCHDKSLKTEKVNP